MAHIPVLLNEVIKTMDPKEGEVFVDGTINRGGHSLPIAKLLGKNGHLIGIDQDTKALQTAEDYLKEAPCPFTLIEGNFRDLEKLLAERDIKNIDGLLLDLGLSSDQLADSGRGFSFQKNEPLLMTFKVNPTEDDLTAREIVNNWEEENIEAILKGYGEESFSARIAAEIVAVRDVEPIETTGQLVGVIRSAVPGWYTKKKIHFATKTFQALRITVNDEIGSLKKVLASGWALLKPGGRMGIISFHSLEARVIKQFYRDKLAAEEGELVNKRAILPARPEVLANPRSRSAQLKVIKKY